METKRVAGVAEENGVLLEVSGGGTSGYGAYEHAARGEGR